MSVISRAQTRLVRPHEVSRDVHPDRGGIAIHWAGKPQRITNHVQCLTRWREWQAFHMGTRGWADIAYNWGVCDHGDILVGRGWGIRSAANGTDDANDRYLAACWLGGQGETPTALALAGFEALIADCRRRGAAHDVQPHRHFYRTECPGPVLTQMAAKWAEDASLGAPPAAPAFPLQPLEFFGPDGVTISKRLVPWQRRVGVTADGVYGPITRGAAERLQKRHGLTQDGLIGPKTWRAAWDEK